MRRYLYVIVLSFSLTLNALACCAGLGWWQRDALAHWMPWNETTTVEGVVVASRVTDEGNMIVSVAGGPPPWGEESTSCLFTAITPEVRGLRVGNRVKVTGILSPQGNAGFFLKGCRLR